MQQSTQTIVPRTWRQLIAEISHVEDELRALDLRDVRALDEHRRKIQCLQVEVSRYRTQQDTAE